MRKSRFYITLLIILSFFSISSIPLAGKDKNVLSYYAINNSIDGQPMIDMENILRFFPVFIYRSNIKSVKVTLYIGSKIFTQNAVKSEKGSCWEVLLPKFDLNQSIQRYEVETIMELPRDYTILLLDSLNKNMANLESNAEIISNRIKGIVSLTNDNSSNVANLVNRFNIFYNSYNEIAKTLGFSVEDSTSIKNIINSSYSDTLRIDSILNTSISCIHDTPLKKLFIEKWKSQIRTLDSVLPKFIGERSRDTAQPYLNRLKTFVESTQSLYADGSREKFKTLIHNIDSDREKINPLIESIRKTNQQLEDKEKERIHRNLIDTAQSGKGVLIGDIDITQTDGSQIVRILYRNYNPENRRLPALDPVEKLSIYRIRYIPFPVIGNKLAGPFEKDIPIVFEAGITFGNVTLSSNESLLSPFSYQRFGIAIAFTPKLFSTDAPIKALALTYDFNAYGSLSAGVNFGTLSESSFGSYFSLGINFKAFQLLLNNTKRIFNN